MGGPGYLKARMPARGGWIAARLVPTVVPKRVTLPHMLHRLIVWISMAATAASAAAANRAPSLCEAGETIVTSCHAGAKLASVCEKHAASGELLYAQYRFGLPGKPEIAIPPKSPFDMSLLRGDTTTGTHGGWEGLSVRHGDVVYTLEHSWDRGEDDASITVSRGGKRLKTIACKTYPDDLSDGAEPAGLRGFITDNNLETLEPGTTAAP